MSEEETTPQTDAPEEAVEADAAPAEGVTELAEPPQHHRGDAPDEELERLRPVCTNAEQKYHQVQSYQQEFRAAEQVLKRFQARDAEVTPADVDAAKKNFQRAKKAYIEAGNEINEGIKPVHVLARSYPEDLVVQNLYRTYLAKLLASLQTRNPPEPFVEFHAAAGFDFERNEIVPDSREEQRGWTPRDKKRQLLEQTGRIVNMLETRYLKRQLQNRLRAGENDTHITRQLNELARRDPEDLHTFIWLAKMMYDRYEKERSSNRRVAMRDEVLSYCKRAFAMIDDFLNLQGIRDQAARDKRRAGYVQTITAIRKPLMS